MLQPVDTPEERANRPNHSFSPVASPGKWTGSGPRTRFGHPPGGKVAVPSLWPRPADPSGTKGRVARFTSKWTGFV